MFGLDNKRHNFDMTYYPQMTVDGMLYSKDCIKNINQWEEIVKNIVAIKEIHKFGVLHNDIKSDNIIVLPNNNVVLIDFGLSCMSNEVHELRFPSV